MKKLLICGIAGKMGKVIYEMAKTNSNLEIVGGVDKFALATQFECPVYPTFKDVEGKVDVIIDFSRPEALDDILKFATTNNVSVVLATTGYTKEDLEKIKIASQQIAIFRSANMSLGVNLLVQLCKKAAEFLGENYDIEIIEKHHNQKVDSPSGTALMLADAINEEFNQDKRYVYGREGKNCKREKKDIGIHAVRGGTIIGEHDVIFTANDETITISHSAQSKQIFASGAIKGAIFVAGKTAGIYNMQDTFND